MHAHRAARLREFRGDFLEGLFRAAAVEFEIEIHRIHHRRRVAGELRVGLRERLGARVQRQAGRRNVFFRDDVAFHVGRRKLRSVVAIHGKAIQHELRLAPCGRHFPERFPLPFAALVIRELIGPTVPIANRVDFDFVFSVREDDGLIHDFGWVVNRVSGEPWRTS